MVAASKMHYSAQATTSPGSGNRPAPRRPLTVVGGSERSCLARNALWPSGCYRCPERGLIRTWQKMPPSRL